MMSLRDHCCAKQSFFEESEGSFKWAFVQKCFKVSAQTHSNEALAINFTLL